MQTTQLNGLTINKLTKAQYDGIASPSSSELYFVTDDIGIYSGTGITINGDTVNHSNSVTAKTAYVDTATTLNANGGKLKITDIKYDAQGHITGSQDRTITLSQTLNTAGSTDTSSKIFLIGATSQATNPQTYSDNEVFVTSGILTAKTFNSTSLTASQAVVTDANKNLVSRGIRNNTGAGALGWTSASTDVTLVTTNTIAYWNGAFTSTTSNLKYSANGEIMGLSSAQTVSGTKTFSSIQKFTNTTDSAHSTDTAAAVSISGGLSVAKKVSAKEIHIDNNQTSQGVNMQYDETLQTLKFVFV